MKNKKSNILLVPYFFLAFSFYGCNLICKIGVDPQDKIIVENCRSNWIYKELQDTITIKLLLIDKKGYYDLAKWPNFFIGITNEKDTIGIVDDFSTKDYEKNSLLTFVPYDYTRQLYNSPESLVPVLTIKRKDKENKYYCSVKTIFYGKLVEE
jgi:hypothetical protein